MAAPDSPAREDSVKAAVQTDQSLLRWLKAATLIAIVFTFGNALWAAWDQGLTYDEYYHLEWPRRLVYDRTDSRLEAFRFDSKTPALIPAAVTVSALKKLGTDDEQTLRFVSRLTPVLYLAGCLVLVALLARSASPATSWFAVLLVALDPNMAANSSIATSDTAYALSVLLLALALARIRKSPYAQLAIGAGLGLAFAMKFTAVLLVPVAIFYVALRGPRSFKAVIVRLFILAVAGCVTVDCLYLFVGIGTPLREAAFQTSLFQRLAAALPWLRLPFPTSILTGIDASMEHNAHSRWSCYLFGDAHPGGVWYYFPAHWLIKTPLALIATTLAGLWAARNAWRDYTIAIVGVLFGVHLIYFSFFFATQIGLRYTLLCIPLASIVAAKGLAARATRVPPWAMAIVALLAIAERVPYWSDPIAFTNLAVWPKSRAYWYTADSNIDYGQNRERLDRYVKESGLSVVRDQGTITPGLYVVGLNDLTIGGNFRSHRWLIEQNIPAQRFGFTNLGFEITGQRFDEYLDSARTVPTLPTFSDTCGDDLPHYPPGTRIPFFQDTHPDTDRLWVVCATSRKGMDIGFTVEQGRAFFGPVLPGGLCATDLLTEGQTTWVRVPPGGRAQMCIKELPFRRTYLAYVAAGFLKMRGQGGDIAIRAVAPDSLQTPYGQSAALTGQP